MTTRRKFIKQFSAIVAGGFLGGNLFSACQTGEIVLTNRSGIQWTRR
ncbi:MAG: twin-arginine translocation signal domain-containing protein [Prevotellaceae bacterium]|jgi:hypothetical protein|nr:twin-arginine translocation signal domain-containing protein [Prevotellaceae bacterium]